MRNIFFISLVILLFSGTAHSQNQPVEGKGFINLNEIGGNKLFVVTAHKKHSPVNKDGSFTTLLSGLGPQLLAIVDENDQTWASITVVPDDEIYKNAPYPKASNIIVDKASIAKSLVTPLVFYVRDPEKARRAIEDLDNFACLPELLRELDALKHTPLNDLMVQQSVLDAVRNCTTEFSNRMGKKTDEEMMDALYDADYMRGLQEKIKEKIKPTNR